MFIFCTSSFSYWNSQRIKKKLGRNLPQTYDTKFGFTSQFPCGLFKPTDEKEEWKGKNRLDWRKKRMKREMEKKRKEKWNKFTKWWWRNWRKVYWRWYPSESQNHPWNRMRVCHCACVCISSLHFFLFVPPLSLSLSLVRPVHHPFEISIHMSLQNFEFTTSQCSKFFYRRYLAKHLELIDDTPSYRLKTQIPELGKATHCNHSTRAHALGFPFQDNFLKIIRKCMQHTIQIPIFVPYIVDLSEEIPFKWCS